MSCRFHTRLSSHSVKTRTLRERWRCGRAVTVCGPGAIVRQDFNQKTAVNVRLEKEIHPLH
jgi:hypothetical protein